LIGDASAQIVEWSLKTQKPLVLEKLDFAKKKTELAEKSSKRHARMLSSFAYQSILTHIKARAFRLGVQVFEVNPAFTSVIGRVKFASRYGLTIHESAALAIARRFLGVSENLPCHLDHIPDGKGGHVALPLPVRTRGKHVWTQWRWVHRKLQAAHGVHVRTQRSSKPAKTPASCDTGPPVSDFVGAIPTCESLAQLFG
jgi:IS605 OrfB family transposase